MLKRSCESRNGAKRDRAREQKQKQRDTASEESKAKEKEPDRLRKKRCIQGESRTTLSSLPETLQTPLCHLHCYLHVVTTVLYFNYLHISGYPGILLREAYSAHAYS